jgi:2-polyprenyl-3-methyl-5-hydroxy-6-metoxy-1,4-benzoquinol methylase
MLNQADYNENYFNGGGAIGGYTIYSSTTYSSETAEQLATKFLEKAGLLGINLSGKKVLVLGCAYGFLVQYLTTLGVDAYGVDFSTYAVSQAPPEIASNILLGDVRLSTTWDAVRISAGLTKNNQKFDVIIDEDMFCCLTNAEATTTRTLAMANSNMFIHLIDINPSLSTWYNYKDIAGWKALLGTSPKEKWYSRFNWIES